MDLITLYELTKDKRELVEKLKSWKVIPADHLCWKCGGTLSLANNEALREGYMWVCKNIIIKSRKRMRCGTRLSLRIGTFFANSQLSMFQILGMVCMKLLYYTLIDKYESLGGEGIVVEVGETKFGQSKCKISGNKEQRILGGYERGTGHVFLVTVKDFTPETLVPIIRKWIRPATTIVSECSLPYDCLQKEGYKHFTVDHSENDSGTDLHTNSIRSIWSGMKTVMPKYGHINDISGYLAKYIFKKRCKELNIDPFTEFLNLAGELFNPVNPLPDSHPIFRQCELNNYDYKEEEEPDTEETPTECLEECSFPEEEGLACL